MIKYLMGLMGGLITYDLEKKLNPVHNSIFKTIGNGENQFYIDEHLRTLVDVEQYNYYDLRPNDTVLDVGACIGGFSLKVSPYVDHVYAIEPVLVEKLERNLLLNNIYNITIIDCVLGDGLTSVRSWDGSSIVDTRFGLNLEEIINICGGKIDFLKCDCEGGEWCIKTNEITEIRRIEAEVHTYGGRKVNDFLKILDSAGFDYITRPIDFVNILVSARNQCID